MLASTLWNFFCSHINVFVFVHFNTNFEQECIPVARVPSAAVTASPATQDPTPCMPPCHTCPLFSTHAPYHAHSPLPCTLPFAMHTPLFTMHTPLFATHFPFATHAPSLPYSPPPQSPDTYPCNAHLSSPGMPPLHHTHLLLPHTAHLSCTPLYHTNLPVNRMTDR